MKQKNPVPTFKKNVFPGKQMTAKVENLCLQDNLWKPFTAQKAFKRIWIFPFILLIGMGLAFGQDDWEELDEVEEVSTRSSDIEIRSGKFEGIFIEKKEVPGNKDVNIHFIFSDEPVYGITYFNFYDSTEKAIILDFYNSNLGGSIVDTVSEFPITHTDVTETQIDFNKGIDGLKPDIRDVVRVKMYSPYNFPYTIGLDEFDVLTISFEWNKRIEKELTSGAYTTWLMLLLALGVIGALSWGTFELIK